jgi:pentatricopeptide repeat protein
VDYALKGREASQRFLSSRVMGVEAERVLIRAHAALGNLEAAEKVIREVRQQGNYVACA